MNLKSVQNVYFLGIGGIGMSGLARYFKFTGKQVAGYDRTPTPLTKTLEETGIAIHYEDDTDYIPAAFRDTATTLVAYTPALPADHKELAYFKRQGFAVHKRAEVLGWVTKDTFCFAVAGTHGKTTVTSILAHLLKEAGLPITAFLGGISKNFNSNFLGEGSEYTVVEADEFDRSFLQLSPDIACITSMDADHLDIYGTKNELEHAFRDFAAKLKPGGKLIIRKGLPIAGITYGIEEDAGYSARNIKIKGTGYIFDIVTPNETVTGVEFRKPGRHNLLNALAAFAMADQTGKPAHCFAEALATFKGIKRRFSYELNTRDRVYIDDYAHHPEEINAVYSALREIYPGKPVLVVFQPHLYSRTRDFAAEFAESLAQFDEILLLDIYPAREQPIAGITSDWLLSRIKNPNKKKVSKSELPDLLKASKIPVLVTLGAGDIGAEVNAIKEALLV